MNAASSPEKMSPEDLARIADRFARSQRLDLARKFFTLAKRLNLSRKLAAGQPLTIRVYSASHDSKDEFRKLLWGDYWVQYELTRCLGLSGHTVTRIQPDIVIHLFGFPATLPRQTYNIAWIYSHPDMAQPQYLAQYDHLFVLSDTFRIHLQSIGFPSELMIGATSREPYPATEIRYPAVFIGNARPQADMRNAVKCLLESGHPFLVWGDHWEQHLPPERIGGLYYENQRLDRLYAGSAFAINDHHEDMRRYGFVAVKIFDILASGGFPVSDTNPGIQEIFGDTVPQFSTASQLQAIFRKYSPGTAEREMLRKRGQQIALSHTWNERAATFSRHIEHAFDPLRVQSDLSRAFQEHPVP